MIIAVFMFFCSGSCCHVNGFFLWSCRCSVLAVVVAIVVEHSTSQEIVYNLY